ncbi:hypothetical protein LTS10_009712 [Elasticomyces elasticus]|nr:hypothetical protein LTS10_009712 [Elasticomyces elasticus]
MFGCLISTISAASQPETTTLARRGCINVGQQIANFEKTRKSTDPEIAGSPIQYASCEGFIYGQSLDIPLISDKLLPGIILDTPTHFAATGIIE